MAKKIGAKIVLEGESEYRAAIKNINVVQKELRSEMKLASTEFKNQQNSIDALAKKQDILTRSLEQQQQKVSQIKGMWNEANSEQQKAAQEVEKLSKAYEDARKALEAMQKSGTASNTELEEQEKHLEELGKELERANTYYDSTVQATNKWKTELNYAEADLVKMDQELQQNGKYLEEAEQNTQKVATSIDEYGNEVEDAGKKTSLFGEMLKANLTSTAIIGGIKAICNGIKEVATAAVEVGAEFEQSMDKVQALSGATAEEMQALENAAREFGASTIYSAKESAEALGFMSLAGWNAEQMLEGLGPVLYLAGAAQMDLGRASDIVTDNLTAFGLSAEDAARFTDQLAFAMANSNTDVDMLGEAYKNCAASASSLGFEVEDVTAVLMTMADAGVKGGEAGTGLSTIMTRLATNTKGCADQLEEYGIQVYDSNDQMNSLSSILGQLSERWDGLTMKQQASLAKVVAGTAQYTKLQVILKGVSEQAQEGGKSFYDYADALRDCDGAAQDMYETMNDNLLGQFTELKSALSELGIATYEVFDEGLKDAVGGATDAVNMLIDAVSNGDLGVSLEKMADAMARFIESAADGAMDTLPNIIDTLTWIIDNGDVIISLLEGIGAGFLAYEGYSAGIVLVNSVMALQAAVTEEATISQLALNAAMEANPIGLIVAAITALTVGIIAYTSNIETASEKMIRLNEEHESFLEKIRAEKAEFDDTINRMGELSELTHNYAQELVNLNEKSTLTEAEQQRMQYLVQALNGQYSGLNLTLDTTTGKLKGSTDGLLDQVDAFNKLEEATTVSEELQEVVDNLTEAEVNLAEAQENLTEVQEQYNEATNNGAIHSTEWEIALREATEGVDLAQTAVDELTQRQEELAQSDAELTEEVEEINRATIEYHGTMVELTDATGETTEAQLALAAAYSEAYEKAKESLDGQIGLFDELNNESDLTISEMNERFLNQQQVLQEYGENIENLKGRVSDELLAALMDLGIDGAGYVKELAEASDEDLATLDENFLNTQETLDDTAESIAAVQTGFTDFFDEIADAPTDFTDTFTESFDTIGEASEGAMETLNTSITTGTETALQTTQTYATNTVMAFNTAWGMSIAAGGAEGGAQGGQGGAQSTVFYAVGQSIPTSIQAGLDSLWPTLVADFTAKCDELVDIAKKKAQEIADAFNNIIGGISF